MKNIPSKMILRVLAVVLVLFGWLGAASALEVPPYRGYVNDYAGMLTPETVGQLEQALADFDKSDSTQVAILTIPSLEGGALEEFSIKVVEKWGVGSKGKDNGVLLLIAKQERKVRIEVGRGLEGVLTDLISGRITSQVITPAFKAGQIDQGVMAGAAAIIQATRGEFKADARRGRGEPSPLFKFAVLAIIATAFIGMLSRKLGAAAGASIFPLAFLFGLTPAWSLLLLLLLVPVGALGGWLLWPLLAGLASGDGHHHGGGFGGGGFGGGGFGGGGGGGFGGFGGGGFGGGGASGSW